MILCLRGICASSLTLRPAPLLPHSGAGLPGVNSHLQIMSTTPLTTQSAAARRSAEAGLRGLITKFAPAHQRLIGAVRRCLQKRLPTAHELVYEYRDSFVISYSPDDRGYEGVLAIRASAGGVDLYFNRGKELIRSRFGKTRQHLRIRERCPNAPVGIRLLKKLSDNV